VSLGLLPSSKVGWGPGVEFLRNDGGGGWLHVHENLPSKGAEEFGLNTLVPTLKALFKEIKGREWGVRIEKIVRVKSYSPKVDHFVFDVRCDDENWGKKEGGEAKTTMMTPRSEGDSLKVDDNDKGFDRVKEVEVNEAMRRARESVRRAFDVISCVGSHEGEEGRRRLREMMAELREEMRFPDL
jgi:hypothetical protein